MNVLTQYPEHNIPPKNIPSSASRVHVHPALVSSKKADSSRFFSYTLSTLKKVDVPP